MISYLYFILDPNTYLPIRSSTFDGIFKTLEIDMKTEGRCSWGNYQEFINTVAAVRDLMREHFQTSDIDLLDAHSFLWTINEGVLIPGKNNGGGKEGNGEKKVEVGAMVTHKNYGEGKITEITGNNIYVQFSIGQRIFPYADAIKRRYIILR